MRSASVGFRRSSRASPAFLWRGALPVLGEQCALSLSLRYSKMDELTVTAVAQVKAGSNEQPVVNKSSKSSAE
jgi:hypothetical protein